MNGKQTTEKLAVLSLSLMLTSAYAVSTVLPQMLGFFDGYRRDQVELLISVPSFAVTGDDHPECVAGPAAQGADGHCHRPVAADAGRHCAGVYQQLLAHLRFPDPGWGAGIGMINARAHQYHQ